jgi:hypothetical protein
LLGRGLFADGGFALLEGETLDAISNLVRVGRVKGADGEILDERAREDVGLLAEEVDGVERLLGHAEPARRRRQSCVRLDSLPAGK